VTGASATDSPEIRLIEWDDPLYPLALKVVRPRVERLHALGDLSLLSRRSVAIVGSRNPTAYGTRIAYQVAQVAVRAGLVVVSGMARGLDARAHRGALDAGGKTIAVLGNGVDVPYPLRNRDLYADILRTGLIVSEEKPGSDPGPGSFPRRNRIIAGLAEALLVVEGKAAGGTSNTVKWMQDLGRPVLAVPGRIDDEVAEGPNKLISEGARPYLGPQDLLDPYGLTWDSVVDGEAQADAAQVDAFLANEPDLLGAEARIFDLLAPEPLHVDAIAEKTALDAGTLHSGTDT
jgi:DNA processing protein